MSVAFAALALMSVQPAAPSIASTSPAAARIGSAEKAAQDFIQAFNAMDEARFVAAFDEQATMFFPAGPFPKERIEGKAAVLAAFNRFFAMARERGMQRLGIQPLDLVVQDFGKLAVISFELRGNGNIGRRSLVMRQKGRDWLIVHFHASSLELEAGK